MRSLSHWPLLIPVVLVPLGCSKPDFTYVVDPAFPTASYRTMALDPRKDRVFIREGFRPLDPGRHRQVVFAEMEARRFQTVAAEEADLWVTVVVLVKAAPEGRREGSAKASRQGSGEGRRGGGRGGMGGGGSLGSLERGPHGGPEPALTGGLAVIVQLQDRRTGVIVWHGEVNPDAKERAADGGPLGLEETLHRLLQPLPFAP